LLPKKTRAGTRTNRGETDYSQEIEKLTFYPDKGSKITSIITNHEN